MGGSVRLMLTPLIPWAWGIRWLPLSLSTPLLRAEARKRGRCKAAGRGAGHCPGRCVSAGGDFPRRSSSGCSRLH